MRQNSIYHKCFSRKANAERASDEIEGTTYMSTWDYVDSANLRSKKTETLSVALIKKRQESMVVLLQSSDI